MARGRRSSARLKEPEQEPEAEPEDVVDDDEYYEEEEEQQQQQQQEPEQELPKRGPGRPPSVPKAPESPAPRKRGRPPLNKAPGPAAPPRPKVPKTSQPVDEQGNPQTVEGDEIVLPGDPDGEKKVNATGELLGGRDYRVRTFTVKGRGDKLYMLSTEPARCMGFRDSYLLFQRHRKLYKVIINDDEKYDLIEREIIPHSYKGRAIGVVTARSIFKEFGSKIVIGGKRVTDDYYESDAKAQGFTPGEIADPTDEVPKDGEYNKLQYVAWHGASSVYHQYNNPPPARDAPLQVKKRTVNLTDENWRYEIANATSQYNTQLSQKRRSRFRGVYEGHTGIQFFPQATQPTKCQPKKVGGGDKIVIETVSYQPNVYTRTGLKDVPSEIYDHLSEDIQRAVRQQQEYEREW